MSEKRDYLEQLRQRAENLLKQNGVRPFSLPDDMREILLELQVHQIELQMQNEELRETQRALTVARDHYVKLYHLSPIGLFTMDRNYRVLDANTFGAELLGLKTGQIVGMSFTEFIPDEAQEFYYLHHRHVFHRRTIHDVDLQLKQNPQGRFFAHLTSIPVLTENTSEVNCLTAVIDTTDHQQRLLAEALNETAQVLGKSLELEEVLDEVLGALRRVIPYDAADVLLIAENDTAYGVRHHGYEDRNTDTMMESPHVRLDDVPLFKTMQQTHKAVLIPNTKTASNWIIFAGAARQQSCLAAPIIIDEQVSGFLNLVSTTPYFFNEIQIPYLETFARQVGLAIKNARLHKEAQRAVAIEERNFLARELHDSVTQSLFTSSILSQSLVEIVQQDPPRAAEQLEIIDRLNRGALAEMRLLLMELRSDALESTPLEQKLRYLVDALRGRFEAAIDLQFNDQQPCPQSIQNACYRIAQEALNNSQKYSSATQLHIQFKSTTKRVQLSIQDNGRGFDPKRVTYGLGLHSMRERANAIGAHLTITSQPGQGTTVKLVWHP